MLCESVCVCGKVWVQNKYFFGAICDGQRRTCLCVFQTEQSKNKINAVSKVNKWRDGEQSVGLYENRRIGWRWGRRERGQGKFKMMERKKALDRHQMSVHLGETTPKGERQREKVPHRKPRHTLQTP